MVIELTKIMSLLVLMRKGNYELALSLGISG